LAWMSDKSYLYDLFFYMQFSRYHQIKSIRFYLLQVASQLVLYTTLWRSNLNQCFATYGLHYAVKIKLESMLRNLCCPLRCEDQIWCPLCSFLTDVGSVIHDKNAFLSRIADPALFSF